MCKRYLNNVRGEYGILGNHIFEDIFRCQDTKRAERDFRIAALQTSNCRPKSGKLV